MSMGNSFFFQNHIYDAGVQYVGQNNVVWIRDQFQGSDTQIDDGVLYNSGCAEVELLGTAEDGCFPV